MKKLVYVEWVDACSPGSTSWMNEDDVEDFSKNPWVIQDSGFVFSETKQYLILYGGNSKENEEYETYYHRIIKIPKACIIKRIDLTRHIK